MVGRRRNAHILLARIQIATVIAQNRIEVSQKIKNRAIRWSADPLLFIQPNETKSYWRDISPPVLTATPLAIAKTENQSKHLSVNKWVFNVVETHNGIHFWKNGMALENITLCEIRDVLKHHHMVSCKRVLRKRWPRGMKKKRVVTKG